MERNFICFLLWAGKIWYHLGLRSTWRRRWCVSRCVRKPWSKWEYRKTIGNCTWISFTRWRSLWWCSLYLLRSIMKGCSYRRHPCISKLYLRASYIIPLVYSTWATYRFCIGSGNNNIAYKRDNEVLLIKTE